MSPTLSIIVPVYNVEKYLHKCIDSILNQSFCDFELILIDDGSSDDCGTICDEYAKKDERIRVIHQSNQGQAAARNYAIEFASGEYLGFVDSDDWIESDMFSLLITSACEYDADMVMCRVKRVNENNETLEIVGYDKQLIMSNIDATKEILKNQVFLSYPVNKIYKRKLFNDIKFPINRVFEDTATIYKTVYKSNKVVTIPYVGYNYLFNINSTCNNTNIDYHRQFKRELDNAIAFGERYIFSKTDEKLSDVRRICATYAYERVRGILHLAAHKKINLTNSQQNEIDSIMCSFSLKDLSSFSLTQKIDVFLYKRIRFLYQIYLSVVVRIHPLNRDL